MNDTYGAVVLYAGDPKSAYFECDICECKFKVRINPENQDCSRRLPLLRVDRVPVKSFDREVYSSVRYSARCPCCGSEVETSSTITEEDEDV